jgi:arylsulfatase A-like enzyme
MGKTPQNVLFITADQWRGECLSVLGHPIVKTPHLDALAAEGTLFRRHYAQATPCGPSRASLFTGLYLQNHRSVMNGTPLDDRHANIARETRKAGYDPALFGYTDIGADPRGRETTTIQNRCFDPTGTASIRHAAAPSRRRGTGRRTVVQPI